MDKTLLKNILDRNWKKEEEWAEKWYNTELTFRAFNTDKNLLIHLVIRHSLNTLALNMDWYYQEDFTHEWGKDKTNASRNISVLKELLDQEKVLIRKIEKIVNQIKGAEKIDNNVFQRIEKGLTYLQYIFIIDLGAYIQPVLDEQLKEKGLSNVQIQTVRDHYFLKKDTYLYQKEEKSLAQIAKVYRQLYGKSDIKFNVLNESAKQALTNHWKKYRCLTTNEIDTEPASIETFFNKLKKLDLGKRNDKKIPLARKYDPLKLLDKNDIEFLQAAGELSYYDNYAGDLYATLDLIFEDLLNKQYDIPYTDITWYSFAELKRLVTFGIKIRKKSLEDRKRYRGMVVINGEIETFYGKKDFQEVKNHVDTQNQKPSISVFSGLVASQGKVVGTVKIVKSVKDLYKVQNGDILVAPYTESDYIQTMKNAAAIVTNYGGITSHASIISREFQIPCIVGTKIATEALQDGDIVEVNAIQGTVRIIKRVE